MIELQYTEGYWWHRIGTDFYCKNAYLGSWDNVSNYEQVIDEEYELAQMAQEEITAEEALNIIMNDEQT